MFREMRRFKQEVSKEECIRVLRQARRAALAVNGDEGYPYAVPINFYYDEQDNAVYFHGAGVGHKAESMAKDGRVCLTAWDEGYHKDDDWAYYVTSVVIFGQAAPVTDESIKYEKARAFGLKYYPTAEGVDAELQKDLKRCTIMKISIEHMTGKLVHEK